MKITNEVLKKPTKWFDEVNLSKAVRRSQSVIERITFSLNHAGDPSFVGMTSELLLNVRCFLVERSFVIQNEAQRSEESQ